MRRIVHYDPGAMADSGVTCALWSWAQAQAASGAEVCVLHEPDVPAAAGARFVQRDLGPHVSTRAVPHVGRHRLMRGPVGLHRWLGRNDLLVLHEGWVPSNLVAARAAERARVPYVVMPHGVYEPVWTTYLKPPMWLRRRIERRVLEGAAAVHVFFESEIPAIAALAPRATFMTVPTGFDVPAEQWSGGGGYVGWVGRVDPYNKGLDVVARAISRLDPAERPVVRIRGYDYKGGIARLDRLIAELGVSRWIRVEGAVGGADKTRFLQRAEAGIHPSRWDCHSLALLENLALGVPCIVSNAIHIARTLEHSSAAVLAAPTEAGLVGAFRQLAASGRDIAGRGRALVNDAFNWATLMPQFHRELVRLGVQ